MYVDDCLIYTIGNCWEKMVPNIQNGLNEFHNWCKNNCLKLNIRKSKSLAIGTKHKLISIGFMVEIPELQMYIVLYVRDIITISTRTALIIKVLYCGTRYRLI